MSRGRDNKLADFLATMVTLQKKYKNPLDKLYKIYYNNTKRKEDKIMNYIYLIWGAFEEYSCSYLNSIYANKEDADKECEILNKYCTSKDIRYFVEKRSVK